MASIEQKAQKILSDMGFPTVKFKGRDEYKGAEQLLYTLPNGKPVMDAPILVVTGNNVEARPWFDMFE
jgi:hypothetical protein